MNDLNSVLVEGTIIKEGEINKNDRTCIFTVVSNHYIGTKKDKLIVNVLTGSKMVDSGYDKMTKGRGVRIVGRLKNDIDGTVIIESEHIEFRPEFKRKKHDESK